MIAFRVQAFDGGDRLAVRVAHRRDARSGGVAVEMDRAGAAGSHPATKLGAGEAENIA
jgi:hypothetical protein